jgi:hypothetical protein
MSEVTILTEDGVILKEGDRAYDYYSMEPGYIVPNSITFYSDDPWFHFQHDKGTRPILNGARICSMEYARQRGFKRAT